MIRSIFLSLFAIGAFTYAKCYDPPHHLPPSPKHAYAPRAEVNCLIAVSLADAEHHEATRAQPDFLTALDAAGAIPRAKHKMHTSAAL